MFISAEGGEGSGKTTLIKKILKYLSEKGYSCVSTREPGDGSIGKQIRALLMLPENEILVPRAELLLFMADRAQHIESFILPQLKAGKIVLCDRFFDSTVVYQGFVGKVGVDVVRLFHNIAFDSLKPDLTFLFDLDPEVGLARTSIQLASNERPDSESRFERKELIFHTEVRKGFLELAKIEPERIKIINAELSVNDVWQQIKLILDEKIHQILAKKVG